MSIDSVPIEVFKNTYDRNPIYKESGINVVLNTDRDMREITITTKQYMTNKEGMR